MKLKKTAARNKRKSIGIKLIMEFIIFIGYTPIVKRYKFYNHINIKPHLNLKGKKRVTKDKQPFNALTVIIINQ